MDFVGQSFIANPLRLKIMVICKAEIGIIAVGVTQIIIMGGIDLSSGSVVGMTAMIAASRCTSCRLRRDLPEPCGLNPIFPVAAGLALRADRWTNQRLGALTEIPAFIDARHDGLGAGRRGWYTNGQPIGNLSDGFAAIGAGWWPVIIFLSVALIFHIAALHPLRKVHLRDRKPARGARLRHPTWSAIAVYAIAGAHLRACPASCTRRAPSAARPGSVSASERLDAIPAPRR